MGLGCGGLECGGLGQGLECGAVTIRGVGQLRYVWMLESKVRLGVIVGVRIGG